MIDSQKIREFLKKPIGAGPWVVFESNSFGYVVDGEGHFHIRGRIKDEEADTIDSLVKLLNGAPELLGEYDDLLVTRNGIGVRRTVQSLVKEISDLRAALTEALDHWQDGDDSRRDELKKLL